MPDELRTLINKPGVTYDETKTHIFYAEDWAHLKLWIAYLLENGGGGGGGDGTWPLTGDINLQTDLMAIIDTLQQNLAFTQWKQQAKDGAGDETWIQMFIDAMQDSSGMDSAGGAYYDSVKKAFCTATPGVVNVLTGGTYSASHNSASAGNAFDNNDSSGWYTGIVAPPTWLKIQCGSTQQLTSYTIRSDAGAYPRAFQLQGSNNNTDWTTVDSRSGQVWTSEETKTFNISSPASYLYWRLYITDLGECYIIEWKGYNSAVANVALQTVSSTAEISPDYGSVLLVAKENEAVTLNTDVIVKIGKDGLTGMTTLTLAKKAVIGNYVIYFGKGAYASGSGVTMKAEVDTANTKNWELYGLTHNWR